MTSTKYLMFVPDGMADLPLPDLQGLTPLQYDKPPKMAELAGQGGVMRANTTPPGFSPGTEVAMPLILGYDTSVLTGRGPLEAAGMGVLPPVGQFAMRANLVRLDEDGTLLEACPDLSPEEGLAVGRRLAASPAFAASVGNNGWQFHPEPGFRQLITGVLPPPTGMTPPHNVQGENLETHWPTDALAQPVRLAREILRDAGLALWPWGPGEVPVMASFEEKYGRTGTVISAVPVVRGLALLAGMRAPVVRGATGTLRTDWRAKLEAAMAAFEETPFVLVHLEAPDDCSHAMDVKAERKAIALADAMLKELCARLSGGVFRVLLMPDHVTSTHTGRHDKTPVPFCLYDSRQPTGQPTPFAETQEGPIYSWSDPIRALLSVE